MVCLYFSLLLHWYSSLALSPNRNINCIFFLIWNFQLEKKVRVSDKTYQKVISKCQTRSTPFPGGVGTTLGNGSELCWEVEFYFQLQLNACWITCSVAKLSEAEVQKHLARGLSVMVHAIATPRKVGTIRFDLMPLVGCLQPCSLSLHILWFKYCCPYIYRPLTLLKCVRKCYRLCNWILAKSNANLVLWKYNT